MLTRQKFWQQAIVQHDLIEGPNAHTIFNIGKLNIAVNQAVTDAGATVYLVFPGTPVPDIRPVTNPLVVNLPDGEQMKSIHARKLDLLWLPKKAREAHIVPGLTHTLLVLIKVLCDTGCRFIYDNQICNIFFYIHPTY